MKYMFDSNAFDKAIEKQSLIEKASKDVEIYITYVQEEELDKIPVNQNAKKNKIFQMIDTSKIDKVPTPVFLVNHTPIGQGMVGNGDVYNALLNSSKNNTDDALIGATCIENGYTLVSEDKQLVNKVNKNNGKAISFNQFLNDIN